MILRRKSKKKQKRAEQAQQQALLATLQANVAAGQATAYMNGSRRASSVLSVPTMGHENDYDENSDCDLDGDMLAESHPSLLPGDMVQMQRNQKLLLDGLDYSNSGNMQAFPSQIATPPINPPQQPSPPSNGTQNASKEFFFRKANTQPTFTSLQPFTPTATPITEIPSSQLQLYQQSSTPQATRSRTSGHGGTLGRKPKEPKVALNPAKLELIKTAVSLGLGRGIDATNKMPWINKKSFQIRRVHHSVVETNEGGILMNYNHEVQSIAEIEEKFLSSLSPPESAVTIHIEDELDRNVSSSRRIVGRRVVNRSIGFQADFEERYSDGEILRSTRESYLVPKDPAEVVCNTQASGHAFEERVCQWIFHRLVHKYGPAIYRIDIRGDESPVDQLAKLISSKAVPQIEEEIRAGCQELIQDLRVTHYVTGMQLGAAEYRVMSDGQYHKKMALEGAFGVDTLASAFSTAGIKQSRKDSSKVSQLRKIGKIEDGRVAQSTQDEVVLQVQIQPITRLIRLPILKSALGTALEKYMDGTPSTEGGPFVIKCTGRDLYLTVNKYNNYEVEGTDNPAEASLFYFQTTDDGGNPFEFHIAYFGEDVDPSETNDTSTVGRYLEAPLNPQGRCPGPLLMKHSVKVKNTRFTLRSRLSKKNNRSHLASWIAGEDAFYVACATKRYQHGSYLALKQITRTGELIGKHLYMTCCDPSIHSHNGFSTFMLFQLCTKEVALSKGCGRETPGKLPVMASEIVIRQKRDDRIVNQYASHNQLLQS